jgi:hypothetical protein
MSLRIAIRATAVAAIVAGTLGACTSTAPKPEPAPTNSMAPGVFVLREGIEQDACGIGLVLKFVPATAGDDKANYALVFGGPVGAVPADITNLTGDGHWPDNAAHPQQGTTFRVAGRQFGVAQAGYGRWVTLQGAC